jgi:predicted O-methyltransferase YrrM
VPSPTLTRLLAAGPPLHEDEWSLGRAELDVVLAELARGRRAVVECGSGLSTVLIARRLRELGGGRLHSLEHDAGWAASTRQQLADEGLDRTATVVEAPLRPHPAAAPGCEWYDRAALGGLPVTGIDLLLVDGPPAGGRAIERSRYPALPELAPLLGPDATVLLDDAGRPGERWVLERWAERMGLAHALVPSTNLAHVYFPHARGGDVRPSIGERRHR